ncbi:MAG TPA: DUF1554 domain-containing protein [Polyangiaceae bacterium]|nr:DUF1554 domain-containing protein [Polyangiaceae bacterium]
MLRSRASLFASAILGVLVATACSDDTNTSFNGGVTDGGGGGAGGSSGSGSGGKGSGGTGSGGKGSGGANSGGASSGGSGGSGALDGGTGGSNPGDSGIPDDGSAPADASAGGSTGSDGATGTGGASDGGATGTGGASDGGASTGGATGSGGASTDAGPHKRVFVTKDTFDGNLKGTAASGLEGADALCQAAADDASLGGTWVAWLSDSGHDAIDRIADVGPWYRIDGQKVFDDKAAITTTGPAVAISRGPKNEVVSFLPWTGTKSDGTRTPHNCNDWQSSDSSNSGTCGSSSATATWTETGPTGLPCSIPYNLYCFEQ